MSKKKPRTKWLYNKPNGGRVTVLADNEADAYADAVMVAGTSDIKPRRRDRLPDASPTEKQERFI